MSNPAREAFNLLERHHDRILMRVQHRKQTDTHELQVWLLNSVGEPVRATGMGYIEPDFVTFQCENEDGTGEYILMSAVHVNVTFKVVKATGKPRKMGFHHDDGIVDAE